MRPTFMRLQVRCLGLKETQLKISKNVGYFKNLDTDLDVNFRELMNRIHCIERQLNALISSIRKG